MKRFTTLVLPLMAIAVMAADSFAQPAVMSINQDVSGTYANTTTTLKGGDFQARFQENGSGTSSGTRNWQFNADGYFNTWGVKSTNGSTSVTLASYNTTIPASAATASANFEGGPGYNSKGRLPATTANYYYTYNIVKGSSYADQLMGVLETSYNPVTISSVTQAAGTFGSRTISITTSGTPSSGENIFVRYSTNSYVASTLVQATGSGTAWSATIPWQSAAVSFYVYTSNKTASTINSEVTSYGQGAHDVSMLNLDNNSGSNYSWTPASGPIIVTSTGGSAANTPTTYSTFTTTTTGAFAALNGGTVHTGTVTVLITADVTTEPGSVALANSAAWTAMTINPNGARTISGSVATPLIDLNGADNVTIDGLNTVGNSLTISNTSTSAVAGTSTIRFINDATTNMIQNCTISGSSTLVTTGTILLSTTTGTTGNDGNIINNNTIGPAGANLPFNGIYSSGTTTTNTLQNSGVQITNNRIFDFFAPAAADWGILVSSGNTDWTITGNSLYQTATRTMTTAATDGGIQIANTSGNNFVISSNYVGGSAVSAGGSAWTIAGSIANRFRGISLSVGSTTASSMQGNTVANFNYTSNSSATTAGGAWVGIYLTAGNANIGTTTGNTIGSGTGAGSIAITMVTNSGGISSGIYCDASSTTSSISNNVIGSVTQSSATIGAGFTGIVTTAGTTLTVNGNSVGSTSTANSITTGAYTGATTVVVTGINNSSSATISISNNTVANLNNGYLPSSANTSTLLRGIVSSSGINTISGNTIRNLTTAANATGTLSSAPLIGINISGSTSGQTISGNILHSLSENHATAAVNIYGIYWSNSSTSSNVIERNFVHSLSTSSTGAAVINGFYTFNGAMTFRNNMIRLGIDAAGSSLTSGALTINGIIADALTASLDNYYFNSVFIGGTGVTTGTANTSIFRRVTLETSDMRDNIFVNNRSNSTGTGKHYIFNITAGTTFTSNYNVYNQTGTGAIFGSDGTDRTTFASWKTATSQDANSFFSDPQFNTPTGTSATVDLHINPSVTTVIEGNGILISPPTDDFDGQTRASFTPVDIGADAGNFTGIDLTGPAITYTNLANTTSTSNRSFSSVTITDNSGVNGTAGTRPRVYYKRSADGNVLNDNTSGTDGWKYAEANGSTSPFDFTINYSLLNGGTGVTVGQTVQYFVVAQDLAATPNVSINSGTFAAAPTSVALTSAAFPITGTINSYTIVAAFTGSYNVGSAETYTSLTAAGGFFATVNGGAVTGNITINITSDIAIEDGANSLNQWSEDPTGSNFTLTIRPDFGASAGDSPTAVRTVSGTNATALFNYNGADRVNVNGVNGSNTLVMRNIGTGATFRLIADASSNTIQNATIEGAVTSATSGVIFFSTGTTTGNDNNTITNSTIRDRSDAAGVPANLIYSAGSSSSITNTSNTISNNQMFNFTSTGILTTSTGNESWTISGNTIYQTVARTTALVGIAFNGLGTNTISQNTIRDNNTSSTFTGINLSDARTTLVSRNKIYLTNGSSSSTWTGINYTGSSGNPAAVTLVNNQITLVPNAASSQTIYGIRDFGFSGNTITMYYSSVYIGGTATGTATWAFQRGGGTPTTLTARNNIFFNNRTGGSASHFAMGDESANTGSWLSDYNLFAGTGAVAASFMDYGSSTTAVSFATWKTGPPTRDANSHADLAASISATNLFTDVAAAGVGNLNINPANAESWVVNGKGIAGSSSGSIVDDYGATGVRGTAVGIPTDIGADEFTPNGGVNPADAVESTAPAVSTTTAYTYAGRKVAEIVWGGAGTPPTSVAMKYFSGVQPPFLGGTTFKSYWNATPIGGSGYSYNITLYYTAAELGGVVFTDFQMAKSTTGSIWEDRGTNTDDPNSRVSTNDNPTTFSNFSVRSNLSPLPIQLASFTAVEIPHQGVRLNWRTLSEINNYGFYVQHKAANATEWTEVPNSFVAGHGTTNEPQNYMFVDHTVNAGQWNYRLHQVDLDGTSHFTDPINVSVLTTVKELAPIEFALKQNYPNPFNPETNIKFSAETTGRATLELYNMLGQKVATLFDDQVEAGFYQTVRLNGANLASGVYLYRLQSGKKNDLKKLLLLK